MLRLEMYITIKTLYEKGTNKSEISKLTGHDWKTVAKVIKQIKKGINKPIKKPYPKILDNHRLRILELLEHDLTGLRIYEVLKDEGGKASYSTVKNYLAEIKKRGKVCIRFHTEAGQEAQVDFGYVGLTVDKQGIRRKTWVFNMRLSYSRLDYFETVYNQKVETFINCHKNAFSYFGGIPEYVKIDNLKAAILEANFYEPRYQELYKSFADYYGFKPLPCRVREPQEKGKTEAGIKYIKQNFFAGRKFIDENDLRNQLKNWLEKVNNRIHGTTQKIPRILFNEQEKAKLKVLPETEFRLPKVGLRTVYHDCHVYIDYNHYSVPYEFVGKEINIEVEEKLVRFFYECAKQSQCNQAGQSSPDKG